MADEVGLGLSGVAKLAEGERLLILRERAAQKGLAGVATEKRPRVVKKGLTKVATEKRPCVVKKGLTKVATEKRPRVVKKRAAVVVYAAL